MGQYDVGAIVGVPGCHDLHFSIQHDLSLQGSGLREEFKNCPPKTAKFHLILVKTINWRDWRVSFKTSF